MGFIVFNSRDESHGTRAISKLVHEWICLTINRFSKALTVDSRDVRATAEGDIDAQFVNAKLRNVTESSVCNGFRIKAREFVVTRQFRGTGKPAAGECSMSAWTSVAAPGPRIGTRVAAVRRQLGRIGGPPHPSITNAGPSGAVQQTMDRNN